MGTRLGAFVYAVRQNPVLGRVPKNPLAASLLCSAVFFAVFLSVFPSGYAVNDDMKVIPLAAGYPAGHPVPFLLFSNVLLGFMLVGLYRLPTALNWEMLIFILAQVASVWLLLDQIFASTLGPARKAFGAAVVLICEAYFALNLTFTTTASFAAIAGCCGLIYGSRREGQARSRQLVMGVALVLIASLIRLETVPLMAAFALPYALVSSGAVEARRLAAGVAVAVMLVAGGWLCNRLYLRAAPAWNAYYFYQYLGSMIQDTHRLENLGATIRRVGWSANDQELFARWYYPERDTYSAERFQFLVDHVSPISSNPGVSLMAVLRTPFAPYLLPYLITMAALSLWMYFHGDGRWIWLAVGTTWLLCLGANAYFVVTNKIADRIFLSTFAATALLTFVIPFWRAEDRPRNALQNRTAGSAPRWALRGGWTALSVAAAVVFVQSYHTAAAHRDNQVAYRQVLADLSKLQQNGTLGQEALIVSPAHGLPLEWSNPWTLHLPPVAYFDIGWLSYSPIYDSIMAAHGISDLPTALYENGDVYIMTRSNILPYIARSYEEHQGVSVSFRPLYTLPNPSGDPNYQDVHLYEVDLSP